MLQPLLVIIGTIMIMHPPILRVKTEGLIIVIAALGYVLGMKLKADQIRIALDLYSQRVDRYPNDLKLKYQLANQYPNDREAYTNGKAEFISGITEKAKQYYNTT